MFAAFAMLVAAATAFAQAPVAAPAPEPASGDTWRYRSIDLFTGLETQRFSLEFLRRDVLDLKFKRVDLKTGRTGFVNVDHDLAHCKIAAETTVRSCASAFRFPLKVGGRHGYEHFPTADGWSDGDCKVEAVESVTVPAGTFDAFRVECEGRWVYTGSRDAIFSGRWRNTHWYAPAVQGQVKYILRGYAFKGGLDSQTQTELVSFKPGGASEAGLGGPDAAASAAAPGSAASGESRTATVDPDAGLDLEPMPPEFVAGTTRFAGKFFRAPENTGYSGDGRVTWANGDLYEGHLVRGSREGKGKFVWGNGQRYEGDWHQDRADGRGKMWFVNGDVYEGVVERGAPRGEGSMAYASGDRYVGQFLNGRPHGTGKYVWVGGQSLEGDWVDGQGQGRGVLEFVNGNRYEGEVSRGIANGSGRLSYASGDTYVGNLKDGVPDGEGTYTWKSGDQYIGHWNEGTKDGHGVMAWSNGDRFEGTFSRDARLEGELIRRAR